MFGVFNTIISLTLKFDGDNLIATPVLFFLKFGIYCNCDLIDFNQLFYAVFYIVKYILFQN